MIVIIKTLVDITETNARRGDDKFKINQQANYMTTMQTVGLRVNPVPKSVISSVENINNLGFGTAFKGEHRYWIFKFSFEADNGLTMQTLEHDYNLVPIISGLEETVNFKDPIFRTTNKKETNIIFEFEE